jgi:hypothetical protein
MWLCRHLGTVNLFWDDWGRGFVAHLSLYVFMCSVNQKQLSLLLHLLVHSSHFWAIFSSFLISFSISFFKNGLQNDLRMNPKMIIFAIIFTFHFCHFFKLRSNAQSFPVTTINNDTPSLTPLYHNSVTTCHPHSYAPSHTCKTCKWPPMTRFACKWAQMMAAHHLGSKVCLFFCSFLLFIS